MLVLMTLLLLMRVNNAAVCPSPETQDLLACARNACPAIVDDDVVTLQRQGSGGKGLSGFQITRLSSCVFSYCSGEFAHVQNNTECGYCLLHNTPGYGYAAIDQCTSYPEFEYQ